MVQVLDRTKFNKTLKTNYEVMARGIPGEYKPLLSGAAAVAVSLNEWQTKITTGGTAGSEDVTIGDGTGVAVGHRKLITLETRSNASDVVNLDHANMANSSGTQATNVDLDADDEFVLVEWNGTKWQVIYSDATITP